MDLFGLHPDRVIARARLSAGQVRLPTLSQSLWHGAVGFGLASLVVFATVAFGERWMYRRFGLYGAYAIWTALFILASGVLSPLVIGPGRLGRFYPLFSLAFFLYAAGWVAAYFTWPNRYGEWLGGLGGCVLLGLTIAWAFGAQRDVLKMILALFVGHSIGYFLGDYLNHTVGGRAGMMLWGAAYGLGLGAGLGYALYAAQALARQALSAAAVGAARASLTFMRTN